MARRLAAADRRMETVAAARWVLDVDGLAEAEVARETLTARATTALFPRGRRTVTGLKPIPRYAVRPRPGALPLLRVRTTSPSALARAKSPLRSKTRSSSTSCPTCALLKNGPRVAPAGTSQLRLHRSRVRVRDRARSTRIRRITTRRPRVGRFGTTSRSSWRATEVRRGRVLLSLGNCMVVLTASRSELFMCRLLYLRV